MRITSQGGSPPGSFASTAATQAARVAEGDMVWGRLIVFAVHLEVTRAKWILETAPDIYTIGNDGVRVKLGVYTAQPLPLMWGTQLALSSAWWRGARFCDRRYIR